MSYEYKKKFRHYLKLSDRQLEEMSAIHCVNCFMDNGKIMDLPHINPKWIERMRWKDFEVHNFEELEKTGIFDNGRVKIRKTKKRYVVELSFNWHSKEIIKAQEPCIKCNKVKPLNDRLFCKKCTKEVGGYKGIRKFWDNFFKEKKVAGGKND